MTEKPPVNVSDMLQFAMVAAQAPDRIPKWFTDRYTYKTEMPEHVEFTLDQPASELAAGFGITPAELDDARRRISEYGDAINGLDVVWEYLGNRADLPGPQTERLPAESDRDWELRARLARSDRARAYDWAEEHFPGLAQALDHDLATYATLDSDYREQREDARQMRAEELYFAWRAHFAEGVLSAISSDPL